MSVRNQNTLLLIVITAILVLIYPEEVFSGGLVPCGVERPCSICDIAILARNGINFVLSLIAAIGGLSIVMGGVFMVLSAGNPGMFKQGLEIIQYAITGLIISAASYLIFGFILVALGFQSFSIDDTVTFTEGTFFTVECDTSTAFEDRGFPDPVDLSGLDLGTGGGAGGGGGGAGGGGGGDGGGALPPGSRIPPDEIRALAIAAGFTPAEARIMEAIAMAESTEGDPNATNFVRPDLSYGLWQINMIDGLGPERRAGLGLSSNEQLFDPATNARAARYVFSDLGQGFEAWSVYRSIGGAPPAYLRYLRP